MADANEMRFSSMPYYSNPQIYGYWGRFYDPNLQRWLNQDPIGEPGGRNLYGFVGNDPIDNIDPEGLSPDSWPFIGPFISNMELNDFARRFPDKDANQFQDYNDAMRYFNPKSGNNWTAGDQSAVQAAAEAAKGGSEGYLAVATAVTPGGAEERGLGALASKAKQCETRPTTTVLTDVKAVSRGKVVGQGNVYLRDAIDAIEAGKLAPRDVFQNREGLLPPQPPGYYQEYAIPTPGVNNAGPQRIIRGAGGEMYYTPDHYQSFIPLN
jgi:RHS repeat-associated protein